MMSTHERPQARGGVLSTSPWTRAPLLLLRRPSVFLAIVGAAVVLAIAAASGVLFLSTLGTASLQAQAAADCPESSLPSATASITGSQLAGVRAGGTARFRSQGLPTPYTAEVGSSRIQDSSVHLLNRKGALEHVRTLTPVAGAGAGAWFPDVFANKIGARPGELVPTVSGAKIRVAGIYQDLAPSPFKLANLPRFFCTWKAQIVPTAASDQAIAATPINYRQAPMLLADEATVASASDGPVLLSWYAPLSTTVTPLSGYDKAQAEAQQAAGLIGAQYGAVVDAGSKLPIKTEIAHHARNGVSGSVLPIDIAGIVVALMLIGGAGVFWATHRSREVRLLVAHGVGPVALGFKAVLETLLPALIGTTGGYFAALGLVRAVGPAAVFEPGTPLLGFLVAVGVLVGGLALIGVIGGLSGRERAIGSARSWPRFVPWELGLLAVAAWMGILIRSGSGVTVDHTIVRVSPLAFVFPILGSTAVLLLAGRLIAWLLPKIGRIAHRRGIAGYFALRRLAGSRAVVVGLIVGTALPCCLLTYGSTVTNGVSHEVDAKYRTNLGAEHVLSVYGVHDSNPATGGRGTLVAVFQAEPRLPGNHEAYVLGIDPKTFADFAFLDSGQRAAVAKLHGVPAGADVPAILVNAPAGTDASNVSIRRTTIPLDVVARSAVFPGLRNGSRPMIVVPTSALVSVDPDADRLNQWWTSDKELGSAYALMQQEGFSVLTELTSDVVIGTTGLLPVTWIFGYLRALAVLIGVVAIAGLIFALAARTRRRTVSYVLSRRMGMSKLTHVRSLVLELVLVVGFGWLAGSGVGAAAFGVIYRALDVYPALPPPMSFVLPAATLALTALVTAAVVLAASLATHALAERAKPAEILRLE
jgi:putative ABC transport system permease protein